MGDRAYSFDGSMVLSDGVGAVAASGFAQAGGVDAVIDLGGNQAVTPLQQARIDAACVIDVTALDAVTTDEAYRLILIASNDSTFAAGNLFVVGEIELAGGILSVLGPGAAGTTGTSVVGRYEIHFTNEQANVKYQYLKLYCVLSGTTPSITFKAFVAVLPEP